MPSGKLICGKRYNPVNLKFFSKFKKDTGIDIDFQTFKDIIWSTNKKIADTIVNEEAGVKLPVELGYGVTTKYKSKKQPIDWINTNKYGKRIPFVNLHSFGLIHHIKWFNNHSPVRNCQIYKLMPVRKIKVQLSKNIKAGKKYFKWENSDFWSTNKMDKMFNKFYKRDHNGNN